MIEEMLYLAGGIAIFIAIKAMLKPKKKADTYDEILDSPEYKVKGRFES